MLDEPFYGLSPIIIIEVRKMIIEQSKYKATIITDLDHHTMLSLITKMCLIKNKTAYYLKDKIDLLDHDYLNEGILL